MSVFFEPDIQEYLDHSNELYEREREVGVALGEFGETINLIKLHGIKFQKNQ